MTDAHLRRQLAAVTAAWAREHGFSRSYVYDAKTGRKPISARLAHALGYRRSWTKIRGEK